MGKYIDELKNNITKTEFSDFTGERKADYDSGIASLVEIFTYHKRHNSHVFFVGNGGSAAISSHMTADYMKNGGMNTVSLYDNAVMSCMGNDYGYEMVFSRPLSFLAKSDDLLVAISSSGESANIINAIDTVHSNGANVLTLTGFKPENRIRKLGDHNIYVPSMKYGIVESIHNLILQQIVDEIMERDGVRL
ncbi:MAG: SIS domain-containing protein [Lachnospiraceae bacterium]|nr:SIS domain-containing protein [Lachnospiraceae bacterium]